MELKRGIDVVCPALKGENPGSRWPKTSLAALRDCARLTPEQLQTLKTICACADATRVSSPSSVLRSSTLGPHRVVGPFVCPSLDICAQLAQERSRTCLEAARLLITILRTIVAASRMCVLSFALAQRREQGVCGRRQ